MIRPAIETILAALMIAAALFLLILGPNDALLQVFRMTKPLWNGIPPVVPPNAMLQLGLSLVALFVGGHFYFGVWAGYPGWRKGLVGSIAIASVWVVVLFVQTRVFGS